MPLRRLLPALVLLLAGELALRPTAQTVHHVDAGATGADDGTSWGDAFVDLQDALAAASAGDEIRVAAGTYLPHTTDRNATFRLKSGVAVRGGFPPGGGDGTLAARDLREHVTVLSGDLGLPGYDADNAYHVVTGSNADSSALLEGFLITAGRADGTGTNRQGGGMVIRGGSPVVRSCRFEGNHADTDGGGLATFGSPRIESCVFFRNTAFGRGGGIFNDGGSQTILNCTFFGNAAGSTGGGLHNLSQSSSITNCIVWTNLGSPIGGSPVVTYCNVQGGYPGTGNVARRPLFRDAAAGDLRLARRSPSIDAGTASVLLPPIDRDGAPRVAGASVDQGAFEHHRVWSAYPATR